VKKENAMRGYTVVKTRETKVVKKYLIRVRNISRPKDIYDIQMAATNMSEVVAKAYEWIGKTTYPDRPDEIIMIKMVE